MDSKADPANVAGDTGAQGASEDPSQSAAAKADATDTQDLTALQQQVDKLKAERDQLEKDKKVREADNAKYREERRTLRKQLEEQGQFKALSEEQKAELARVTQENEELRLRSAESELLKKRVAEIEAKQERLLTERIKALSAEDDADLKSTFAWRKAADHAERLEVLDEWSARNAKASVGRAGDHAAPAGMAKITELDAALAKTPFGQSFLRNG